MVSTTAFSHLVSLIYASALAPARWGEAITEIHTSLRDSDTGTGTVRSTALAFADGSQRAVVGHLLPEAEKPYDEYYGRIDHVLHAVEQGPVGVVRVGDELIAPRAGSEFHADWVRPNDIEAGLFMRLTHGNKPACLVVAGSQRSRPFATEERFQLVTALIPHLQQAIDTQSQIAVLAERATHLAEAVDRLPHGVVVITTDRYVVDANGVADDVFAQRDGLGVRGGALFASMPKAHRILAELANRALSRGVRSGGSVSCERISGKRSYVVHVVPLDGAATDFRSRPLAMVLIVDPTRESRPAADVLRQLYGLTVAEAAVACLALHGQGVPAISDQLSLSSATVRTHLRAIFSKTGTHRQAELVRLLSTAIP